MHKQPKAKKNSIEENRDLDEKFSDAETVKEVLKLFDFLRSLTNITLCIKQAFDPKSYEALLDRLQKKKMKRVALIIEK